MSKKGVCSRCFASGVAGHDAPDPEHRGERSQRNTAHWVRRFLLETLVQALEVLEMVYEKVQEAWGRLLLKT